MIFFSRVIDQADGEEGKGGLNHLIRVQNSRRTERQLSRAIIAPNYFNRFGTDPRICENVAILKSRKNGEKKKEKKKEGARYGGRKAREEEKRALSGG